MSDTLTSLLGCLFILAVSCATAGILLFFWTSIMVVTVRGPSMSPAFEHGDRVLVFRYWPRRWLRKGQVVILWPWLQRGTSIYKGGRLKTGLSPFVKRIAGTQGDTLVTSITELSDEHREGARTQHDGRGMRTWQVPEEHIFLRADNGPSVADSLVWGPVPNWTVLGLVLVKLPSMKKDVRVQRAHAASRE
ncbi:MAG TPA: signal peptidase I [Chloroflexia bacterium]|nr:signal peptidase I [Chloroflexia bacterium]